MGDLPRRVRATLTTTIRPAVGLLSGGMVKGVLRRSLAGWPCRAPAQDPPLPSALRAGIIAAEKRHRGAKRMVAKTRAFERLLEDFEPDFAFEPVDPLPASEFAERDRRIRREAALAGCDALVLHTDIVGWYHTSLSSN